MKRAKLITAALLIVAVGIVVLQNRGSLEIQLLFATVTMPRAMFVLLVAAAGFGSGFLVGRHRQRHRVAGPPQDKTVSQ